MAREKNLVLGAGKLFFDRWDENDVPTGEFYLGNTTSVTRSVNEERQEHYSSDTAEREKDASIVTRSDVALGFTLDDIQPENIAMMLKGTTTLTTISSDASEVETLTVKRGRWYQLGVNPSHPTGVRAITLTSVTDDAGSPVAIPGGNGGVNYEVDLTLGRIFIKEDATGIADGDGIIVTYAIVASSRLTYVGSNEQIRGSLRYIADNTAGSNTDYFWPKIEVSPDGDYELKGDSWNEMSFSGEVLTKGTLAKEYGDGRPTVT